MTRTRLAGWSYALCWVTGLLLVAGPPTAHPTTTEVRGYLAVHATAAVIQSSLVHGLAALCLLVVVRAAAQRLDGAPAARLLLPLGTAAVAVSLAQWLVMVGVWVTTGRVSIETTVSMLTAIGFLDTVKLLLLGVLVWLMLLAPQARYSPGWFRWFSTVLAVLLPLSGLAFIVDNSYLYGTLYLSLPLLIGWVCAAAYGLPAAQRVEPVGSGTAPAVHAPAVRSRPDVSG